MKRKGMTAIGCILLFALLITFYGICIEPKMLTTKIHDIGNGDRDFRVVQFSDIHLGPYYSFQQLDQLVAYINRLSPDIICFTGDLFDNYPKSEDSTQAAEILAKLNAPLGKYAVFGNHDYGDQTGILYEKIMTDAGFEVLRNSGLILPIEAGKHLWLGGADDALQGSPAYDSIREQIKTPANYKLLLLHEPDVADEFARTSLDLVLSGHSHGGQIRQPFRTLGKPPLGQKYVEDFYTVRQNFHLQLYVNRGIGTTILPIRLGMPPEVSVFDISMPLFLAADK